MRFEVIATEKGDFTIVPADVRSCKMLELKGTEFKGVEFLSFESIISKIKEETGKYFKCGYFDIKMDMKTKNEISKIVSGNKRNFESE